MVVIKFLLRALLILRRVLISIIIVIISRFLFSNHRHNMSQFQIGICLSQLKVTTQINEQQVQNENFRSVISVCICTNVTCRCGKSIVVHRTNCVWTCFGIVNTAGASAFLRRALQHRRGNCRKIFQCFTQNQCVLCTRDHSFAKAAKPR